MDALLLPVFLLVCSLVLLLIPLLLLYAIPVQSELKFTVRDKIFRESITITWGFIGIMYEPEEARVTVLTGRHILTTFTPGGDPKPVIREEEKEIATRVQPSGEKIASILQKLIQSLKPLGSLFWQESRFAGADGKITLGLGDPALTGMCYGSYWASRFVLESLRIHIEMEPVFDREVFACDIAIRMILRHPLLFIIAAIRILVNPATRELISLFRQDSPGAAAA